MKFTTIEAVSNCVYDELIRAILFITSRLDLSTSDKSDEEMASESPESQQANTPKDFIVFINLVDFCK